MRATPQAASRETCPAGQFTRQPPLGQHFCPLVRSQSASLEQARLSFLPKLSSWSVSHVREFSQKAAQLPLQHCWPGQSALVLQETHLPPLQALPPAQSAELQHSVLA